MLARLLELGKKEKYAFWAFFVGSYTYVLFSFVVEQYIMAYFYVVLTIYVWKNSEKKNYAYFGAVSTMLTSGVLFPMITKKKKWKEWITDLLYCLVVYFELVILCGQLPQFLNIRNKLAAPDVLRRGKGDLATEMDPVYLVCGASVSGTVSK